MKLSVYFTPAGLNSHELAGRPVLVVDVLRATTTMVTALGHGARTVVPAVNGDEALRIAHNLNRDDVLLIGERGYHAIPGFALGNSPREMARKAVQDLTLVMATTNGTSAIRAADPGHPVFIGAVLNFSAAAAAAKAAFEEIGELVILCGGHDRRFALEDAYVAGRFARAIVPGRLPRSFELNDAAVAARELVRYYGDKWKRAIGASAAARTLKHHGLHADIVAATQVDEYDVVPQYTERQVRIPTRG